MGPYTYHCRYKSVIKCLARIEEASPTALVLEGLEAQVQWVHLGAWALLNAQMLMVLVLGLADGARLSGVRYLGLSSALVLRALVLRPLFSLFAGFFLLVSQRYRARTCPMEFLARGLRVPEEFTYGRLLSLWEAIGCTYVTGGDLSLGQFIMPVEFTHEKLLARKRMLGVVMSLEDIGRTGDSSLHHPLSQFHQPY
ncbi:hypothetical protein NDU88_001594 [Pleurodeles waltl]|uniref:Frizzled/Smoothened 7TM domain-containing protein n=1 Tax=Pleurodeles waltl TaxID=8319 RepID=A0AAV7RD24_PLEWA|nr:hypothetical protein NDU88_001594 [Pleurodeles waltl]